MARVLIVDDSLLAEHALKSYFIKLNHTVVGLAKTGEIGMKMVEEHNPDIITVDAVMPGMSGQEFIQYLNEREQETGERCKILMISSDKISSEDRTNLRVDKYLLKPITLAKIEDTLNEIL